MITNKFPQLSLEKDQGIKLLINFLVGKLVEDISSIEDYFKSHQKFSKVLKRLAKTFGDIWTNISLIFGFC